MNYGIHGRRDVRPELNHGRHGIHGRRDVRPEMNHGIHGRRDVRPGNFHFVIILLFPFRVFCVFRGQEKKGIVTSVFSVVQKEKGHHDSPEV